MHVVGEMIDVVEAGAFGLDLAGAQPLEIDVIDRSLGAITVDEIDLQPADPLDGRNIELHRADLRLGGLGAERQGALDRLALHRPHGRPWRGRKAHAFRQSSVRRNLSRH